MLSVDKFPYPRKQTRCIEFIPCSSDVCQILKRFHSFKIPDTPFYGLNHRINTVLLDRIAAVRKADGGRDPTPLWSHQWRSFLFIIHADDVKREIRGYTLRLLANQKWVSAPSMGWNDLSMLGLKLNHISKRGTANQTLNSSIWSKHCLRLILLYDHGWSLTNIMALFLSKLSTCNERHYF